MILACGIIVISFATIAHAQEGVQNVDTAFGPSFRIEVNGVAMPASQSDVLSRFGKPHSIEVYENTIGWYTELDDSIQEYHYKGGSFAVYRDSGETFEAQVDEIDFKRSHWRLLIGKDTLTEKTSYASVVHRFKDRIDSFDSSPRVSHIWLRTTEKGVSDDLYLLEFRHGRLAHFRYVYPD